MGERAVSGKLWRRQSLLQDSAVRAEEAGRRRRSPELAALVEGPSIDLGRGSVKLEARSLLTTQELRSPGELLTGNGSDVRRGQGCLRAVRRADVEDADSTA